tara:strand:+ start:289 stop:909 length:621 start_codon:yes stop_codon:yes gene_type:complete
MAKINTPYYVGNTEATKRDADATPGLPVISVGLDSVRAYQFEIHFEMPTGLGLEKLTLAAKQVTAAGFTTEAIEVHRVNDKVFYPGKASPEELTVTFDNLYDPKVANTLWTWFTTIYNPVKGTFTEGRKWKSEKATIISLDNLGQPTMQTILYGVYPQSWKTAEFNYSTNEFHTIEMVFRYDFMDHGDYVSGGKNLRDVEEQLRPR